MRKRHMLSLLALSMLMNHGVPAFAAFETMVVNIEGTELTNFQTAGSVHYIDIAGSNYQNGCATYKIEPNSTTGSAPDNLARVEAVDGSTDYIWIRNAKITATSDCVDNAHIYFWAVFDGPPNTGEDAAKPKVTIQRTATGVFSPATNGNWITISSSVQNPPYDPPDGLTGDWQEIGQIDSFVVTAQTGGSFNKARSKTWTPPTSPFTGRRIMKGDFQFKLENNGNKLIFDNTTSKGIKLNSTTAANN